MADRCSPCLVNDLSAARKATGRFFGTRLASRNPLEQRRPSSTSLFDVNVDVNGGFGSFPPTIPADASRAGLPAATIGTRPANRRKLHPSPRAEGGKGERLKGPSTSIRGRDVAAKRPWWARRSSSRSCRTTAGTSTVRMAVETLDEEISWSSSLQYDVSMLHHGNC